MVLNHRCGCIISTVWYQPTCVMLNIRDSDRLAVVYSLKPSLSAHTPHKKGLVVTVFPLLCAGVVLNHRYDCIISSGWYRLTSVMLNFRTYDRLAVVHSLKPSLSAHTPLTRRLWWEV